VHLLHDDAQRFMEGYESVSTDSKDFRGQNVLIVGAGNAALEIANSISTQTAHVHLMHRSRLRFSWESHYVGLFVIDLLNDLSSE
jgi:thioredoxin reductase